MIAYRIQQGHHPLGLLLDPATQLSTSYCNDESVRSGVSACRTIEDLADYLAHGTIALDDSCLIVATRSHWADEDDALGAILVIPTAIVSADLVDDNFHTLVNAACDRIYA